MNHEKSIEKCKAIVRERIENEIADPSGSVPEFSAFYSLVLQNTAK
ncbi:hypothetical protein ACTPL8_002121 [Enterococcus faecium]